MKRASSIFPLLVVAGLAAGSFWLEYVVNNERPSGVANRRHDPDAVVENFSIDRFDNSGRLQAKLSGKEMLHYPDDDSADIVAPRFDLLNPERPAHITATSARATEKATRIVMTGNVRGVRPARNGAAEQVLTTEELTVLTDDEIARSDQATIFTQGSRKVDAAGFEWNNVSGLLTLSQVRAFIPPTAPNPPTP